MAMDTTFSDDEKRFLLAEMIKQSQTNVDALVQFVKKHAVGYKFFSIVVPQGRNLEQCVQAAEHMLNAEMPRSSLERASVPSVSHGSSGKKVPAALAMSASSPPVGEGIVVMAPMHSGLPPGQFSPAPTSARGSHVPIQPRPQPPNEGNTIVPSPTQAEGPPAKKRRGRPPRKPIEYSMPAVAPKPIAPLAPHPGGGHPAAQHPYPSPHGLTAPYLPTGTPPTEGSLPGTPTPTSTVIPSAAGASQTASTTGTPKGRKRMRQPTIDGSTVETGGRMTPSGEIPMRPTSSDRNEEGMLPSIQRPPSAAYHEELESRTITTTPIPTEIADPSAPRYVPDDRTLSIPIPQRGPTLAPLARGEPSTQPNSTTKRERPTPLTP